VRLLVIEDDDAIRDGLERGLRADGFTVDSCADGASGLWRGIDGGYAAIILDLLLPGMSGYRVCEQLRGVDPSIIDIYLRRLRTKLHPTEVENVRGLGYRIGA